VLYREEAAELFMKYVPRSGQAETEQGELVRAVEKLADEARRNANANWDAAFERLAEFVRDRLTSSPVFDRDARELIDADIDRILDHEDPERGEELYGRLLDRVVEWARAHPRPIPLELDLDSD
jgi:hypothetical protein